MSDADELKKENKKLKRLLKDAVELLNKYKDVIQSAQGLTTVERDSKQKKKSVKKSKDKPATKKK